MKKALPIQRTLFLVPLFVLLIVALCFPDELSTRSNVAQAQVGSRVTAQSTSVDLQMLQRLTNRALAICGQMEHANFWERKMLRRQFAEVNAERQSLLMSLMRQNPSLLSQVRVPDHILATLPESVRSNFEEDVELEGEVEAIYEESETESRLHHFLKTGTKRLELHFSGNKTPDLLTGTRIRVHGVRVGDDIALDGGADASTSTGTLAVQTVASISPNTFGEQRVLVLLVNFQDKTTQPWTSTQVRDVVFNSVNNFYTESSYQQTWLTGDVFGWYTLPITSATCDQNTIATYAKQAATAAGVNLAAYNRHVFAFPTLSCGWTGWGTYGGNPSQAWINGSMSVRTVGHELGHGLGLYHARALDCGADVLGSNCSVIEYGDSFDILGQSGVVAHSHAAQKERLGWLGYGISPPITTVQSNGTYWIDPYESAGSNPKALKILKSTDPTTGSKTWYYVEFRRPIGFDGFISGNTNAMNGVVVHTGTEGYSFDEYLLDMTPSTSSFSDAALVVGRSYNDPSINVTISPLLVGTTGASVMVSFGPQPCVRANPSMTISPSASQWVSAGSTVNYQISLTNNDSGGCVASSFDLQSTVPSGWTSLFDNSTITLSPGANATTAVKVTSPTSAADGYYNISVTASNSSASSYAASSSVTCSLMSGLTVTLVSDKAEYSTSQTASITANVTAGSAAVSGANLAFTITKPNGAKATGTATTGSNGSAIFKYRFNKQKDPVGTYQVAVGANVNGVIGSGATSFIVR